MAVSHPDRAICTECPVLTTSMPVVIENKNVTIAANDGNKQQSMLPKKNVEWIIPAVTPVFLEAEIVGRLLNLHENNENENGYENDTKKQKQIR
mmetsp:Transcript_38752/g.42010  ORF Transcript_38752/g.42010 Transcript_38752/m.42010 type:complete len:94 (-) Transcript_38752:429-710(-)